MADTAVMERTDIKQIEKALGSGARDLLEHRCEAVKREDILAPGPDYVERAFNPAKYGGYSLKPVMEITIPSLHDPDLVPEGKHVLSAVVQFAPYDLKAGWSEARQDFARVLLEVLETYAPGLGALVTESELLTPADIEREFGMTGGHWHHGELVIDQMLMLRPVPGAAQYAAPVPGLYLCGSGAHPGGGVSGLPGHHAAKAIIADVKRGRVTA